MIDGPGAIDPDYEIAEITIYPEGNDIYISVHNLTQQRAQVHVRSKCICKILCSNLGFFACYGSLQ